jgi:hypothetical protein
MKSFASVVSLLTLVAFTLCGQTKQLPAGAVLYERYAESSLDPYTVAPNLSQQQQFRSDFFRMDVFSPYFDPRTQWYPTALVYQNAYGILPSDPLVTQHPDWLMHDASGNLLWIPFDCNGKSCARYAGDFSNPNFRSWWIANAAGMLAKGYLGMLIDDVDMELGASDASYSQVPPLDYTTGQPMTSDVWMNEMASFLTQIRQAFPKVEISENSVWYAHTACCFPDFSIALNRDLDPRIQQQIASADVINKEAGIASDQGLQGGTGVWSLNALFAYFDRLHAAGKRVTIEEFTLDRTGQEYGLAGYFIMGNGGDRYGDRSTNPIDSWWNGFNVNLGNPYGPRTYTDGLFQRNFTGGIVLLNDPWAPLRTIPLSEPYTRLDGSVVTSVTLGPKQGAILLGAGAPGQWASDMTPLNVLNARGALNLDQSVGGNILSIGGNTYLKGLGTRASSEIDYSLGQECTRFTATVGVDDEVPTGAGNVDFQIWADGVLVFDSGKMTGGNSAKAVDVDITNRWKLGLIAIGGSSSSDDSHADWANAHFECQQMPASRRLLPVVHARIPL